MQEVKIVCGG